VHDRRINGQVHTFGNHGALWMNAMTWFDHATGSIWTQPWGRALTGDFKGTQLKLLPFSLVPWATWKAQHPDTLALVAEGRLGFTPGQTPTDDFVAGIALGDVARGYYYPALAGEGVINDVLNSIPLLLFTDPETRSISIFVRQLSDGTLLTFSRAGDHLVDDQTGSVWDTTRGIAIEGELKGQGLREIPYVSSYDWAWLDFYPQSDFYTQESS